MARAGAALRALLAKNWTLKARHPVATWSELVNPLLCILLFALLKRMDTDLRMPAGWTTVAANASAPGYGSRWSLFAQTDLMSELNSSLESAGMSSDGLFGDSDASGSSSSSSSSSTGMLLQLTSALKLPKFYFTETTMSGLLVSLALQAFMEGDRLGELNRGDMLGCALKFVLLGYTGQMGASPYAVPVECRRRVVPYRIAITPDNVFTRKYFAATMDKWHPRLPLAPSVYGLSLLTAPSFRDSSVFFDNETALEAYMATEDYGSSSKQPKIYAAIAFEQFPEGADIGGTRGHPIAYSLRFNATRASSGFPSCVPHTRRASVLAASSDKLVNTAAALSYSTRGFMTLQTAISRFLNCIPDWDAASQSTTGECQLLQATSNASNGEEDARLMQQLEGDMILSSAFEVITSMKDLLPEGLRSGGSSSDGELSVSPATIPDSSKQQLLQSLRIAPQAHMGAGVIVAPKPAFRYAPFYDKVSVVFPVGFVLSYLYTVSRMVVAFLTEKETRSRELMRIFGVSDALLFASWLLTYVVLLAAATALQTVGARALLFPHSSPSLLFAFFFSFALSSFGFAFLVSAFFSRARSGSLVGMALFFMIFFVSYSFGEETSESQRTWASLLSPVALAQGISILAKLEAVGVGVSSANASELVSEFRFKTAIYMQLVDFALYVVVAVYAQKVVPQEFGVPERWYFFAIPSYWRRSRWYASRLASSSSLSRSKVANEGEVSLAPVGQSIEPVGEDLRRQEREARAIVIAGLSKQYKAHGSGGVKTAVDSLRLTLYEGQVTCLLGRNGAGKSTLISMLTGMTAPSSGEALIRGHPISTSMPRVRESLGYCPQASVLYPELTVEEHLRLYGRIKGLTCRSELDKEVHAKMGEVGLETKRRTKAYALSGGMQRRLSLAIAFLGESKAVFLDEPTSGMDPYSRRSMWELIRSSSRGRVVVLTTHFMDEADVLGDRIAILADGTLQCVGSSLFLKNHYGVGYRLSITLQASNIVNHSGQSEAEEQDGAVSSFVSLVRSHVPLAVVATSIGTELTLQLPFESAPTFPALFRALDSSRSELGVLSYAISVTTLEEVFLKVLEGGQQQDSSHSVAKKINFDGAVVEVSEPPAQVAVAVSESNELVKRDQVGTTLKSVASGGSGREKPLHRHLQHRRRVMLSQFAALVRKRVQYGRRDRNMLVFRTVLPIVVIFTGLAALRQSMFLKNDPKKLLETASEYSLGRRTPIPVSFPGETLSASAFSDVLKDSTFSGGELFEVEIPQRVYNGSMTPTVFGVAYSPSELRPNDTSGHCLRFSEIAFENGYGVEAPDTITSSESVPIQSVDGQYGGYVVYGSTEDQVLAYNVLVNTSATHAAPIYKAMMDEAIHKHLLVSHATSIGSPMTQEEIDRVTIRVSSHPLPLSFKTRTLFSSFLSLPAVIFVVIAFTFIPASVMPFLVREKQDGQNAKYQQLLSGVSLPAYWLANFAFDLALYVVPMAGAILLLRGFGVSSSLSSSGAACSTCTQDVPSALVTLFALFGTAVTPWTYLLSHFMHDPRACLLYTVMLNFLLGIVLILVSYTMGTLASTKSVNDVLVYVWRLSPLFSLGNGLLSVIVADIKALYGLSGHVASAFDAEIAGTDIAYLAIEGPVYFLLTVFVDEYRNCTARHDSRPITGGKLTAFARSMTRRTTDTGDQRGSESTLNDSNDADSGDENEDEDIAAETRRLRNDSTKTGSGEPLLSQPVKVVGLRKRYPNGKLAVRNLTFGLGTGECFGFLGINGAGKTTTMRILTGDLAPSAGSAFLNGFDILTQRRDARRSIGYCPQFDALLDLLTVREHLELYAQLKGLTPIMDDEIARLLRKLHLEQFEHKLAGALSGGNKRKLSVAIALLGDPKVVFLDEPSTGMDPASRRLMWDVILDMSVRSKRSTVVLTTHSMDECEALCSKAGIMVDGRLQCLGSISHLKARFGDGFLLDCKLRPASSGEIRQIQLERLSAFGDEIDSSKVTEACAALGDGERAGAFMASVAPSTSLSKERAAGHAVSVSHLCAWWVMEDRMAALVEFLHRHFGCGGTAGAEDDRSADRRRGEVVQLERQGDYCRYRLASSTANTVPEMSLAEMFELVEGAKAALTIQEYSVSHTSLEQIFNNFARQQQSPEPAR